MSDRDNARTAFAADNGLDVSTMTLVAGDASNRTYYRGMCGSRQTILMDAPPEKGEDVRPFIRIAKWLVQIGLSAPEIYAEDTEAGFLLIEDFGDDLFARILAADTSQETLLYSAASDVLIHLHQSAPPKLDPFDAPILAELAALSFVWYRGNLIDDHDTGLDAEFENTLKQYLEPLEKDPKVLVQRDYHAENLLWLPNRSGVQKVGLLDFQEAMLGHPAYDLVSILQDARRDVSPDIQSAMLERFASNTSLSIADFSHAYHLLGFQRNMRILGVFARLCIRDGKPGYVDLIPRIWGHIQTNLTVLEQPDLTRFVAEYLPVPTADIRAVLKSKSA